MISTHVQQGEPLPNFLARKSRQMLSLRSNKKTQAEKDRSTRENENLQQAFFKLPAELRNVIYEKLLPTDRDIRRSLHHRSQGRVPALLQVCRFIRQETYPVFYGKNLVIITLQHLTQHVRSPLRMRSSVNLLPQDGTIAWRRLRLESCSRCFHSDGFAVLANIDVWINREKGTVDCRPRAVQFLRPCCQVAQREFSTRLRKEIQSRGFHDGNRKLRKENFERLARAMDENRGDWPKSPKRVIPQRFVRV